MCWPAARENDPLSIPVTNPFGVLADTKMPFLARALDPVEVQIELAKNCPTLGGDFGRLEVLSIQVVRYKPEQRCLIEYRLSAPRLPAGSLVILGKVRGRGLDKKAFRLVQTLWRGEFGPQSFDEIRVPEPLGTIPPFQMWLQSKVPGSTATALLAKPEGVSLAKRIAEAIHKLHKGNLPAQRSHGMDDELRILHERLALVAQSKPEWGKRLEKVLAACRRLGASVAKARETGIHRDFYPAQVVVDGTNLYLLDLDWFSRGDPALDIGNFAGHLTEQSLRSYGNPLALADREMALIERFAELSPEVPLTSVQAYATLTLVRHIYLSTQFPERNALTSSLLSLCEERLTGLI